MNRPGTPRLAVLFWLFACVSGALREYTAEEHWSEWLDSLNGFGRAGIQLWHPVPDTFEGPIVGVLERENVTRAVRQLTPSEDRSRVDHTNVLETQSERLFRASVVAPREDGFIERRWAIEKEDAAQANGIVHPASPGPLMRFIFWNSFPEDGMGVGTWATVVIPKASAANASFPPTLVAEAFFGEPGGNFSSNFAYSPTGEGDGVRYVLLRVGEIQESPAVEDLVGGRLDFDQLSYRFRTEQLPTDPGEWLPEGGWTGRVSSIVVRDGKLWVSEGEDAVWAPPDPSKTSMALVLTGGEGYFFGPREILPAGTPGGADVVFETGKRSSETAFQRLITKFGSDGSIVRVDHELYQRDTSRR